VHVRGVGATTERRLWDAGLLDWRDVLENGPAARSCGRARLARLASELALSEERLASGDAAYFGRRLRSCERWRLFADFRERAAFLDIETTGAGRGASLTLVGVYAGGRARLFAEGVNLDDLPGALEPYDLLVTYNGACFDLPILARRFGSRLVPAAHIDLRYVLGAVGARGGLKAVERRMGLLRPGDLAELDGRDAVRLWHEYRSGSRESLRTLARYNLEDILNLEPLLDAAIRLHVSSRALPLGPPPAVSTPESRAEAGGRALAELGAASGLW
jgi:uncharacterized protein YprB with RNaseH-like and TPR domain